MVLSLPKPPAPGNSTMLLTLIVQSVIYSIWILTEKYATFFIKALVLKLSNTLFLISFEYTWVNWWTCDTFETSSLFRSMHHMTYVHISGSMEWNKFSEWIVHCEIVRCCMHLHIKFIYSEKATKFCEIFTLLLSYVVPVKSKVKISQILWPSQNIYEL